VQTLTLIASLYISLAARAWEVSARAHIALVTRVLMAGQQPPPHAPGGACNTTANAVWDPLFNDIGGFGDSAVGGGLKFLAGGVVIGLVLWLVGAKMGRSVAAKAAGCILAVYFLFGVLVPHWQATYGCGGL